MEKNGVSLVMERVVEMRLEAYKPSIPQTGNDFGRKSGGVLWVSIVERRFVIQRPLNASHSEDTMNLR